ncbi:MAG: LysM peptidoglycan-binding domain-containing protein [Clostridiales bacterium]
MLIHTVRKGDTLWQIAKVHNISLDALIAANPQIPDPNYIMIGTLVNVPTIWQEEPEPQPEVTSEKPYIYFTAKGDNLSTIAEHLGIPIGKMIYYNRQYSRIDSLPEKTRIIIPAAEAYPSEIMPLKYQRRR